MSVWTLSALSLGWMPVAIAYVVQHWAVFVRTEAAGGGIVVRPFREAHTRRPGDCVFGGEIFAARSSVHQLGHVHLTASWPGKRNHYV